MDKTIVRSGHPHRKIRSTVAAWPRLMDVHLAAVYCSVGERTVEDWIHERILEPVPMPGSILKDKNGNIIAHSKARRIKKLLIDKNDLDSLIEERKAVR